MLKNFVIGTPKSQQFYSKIIVSKDIYCENSDVRSTKDWMFHFHFDFIILGTLDLRLAERESYEEIVEILRRVSR